MLFEAITWALYGKMARYGDERIGGEEVCFLDHPADVTVFFQTSHGYFRVRRRRRRMGAPSLAIHAREDMPHVTDDGWTKLAGTRIHAADATDDVASLLGIDYRTLRGAIFLQGSGFDIAASTYSKQIKMLEAVLRFDDFTRAAKVAADRARAAHMDAQRVIDQIASHSGVVEQCRTTISQLESLDESQEEDRIIQEIRDARGAKKELASLDVEWHEMSEQMKAAQTALTLASHALATTRAHENKFGKLGGECPTCYQLIPSDHVARLLHDACIATHTAYEREDAAERTVLELEPKLHALGERVATLREQSQSLPHLNRQLESIRARAAQRLGSIVQQTTRRDEAEAHVIALTESVADTRRMAQLGSDWRTDFETLKAETLGAAGPVLNEAAQRYEHVLADGALHVEFSTLRESRSEDLLRIYRDRVRCSYESLSNGERRRVDLIVALALRAAARWRMSEPINVCVWDEVFDKLDESGLQRAVEVLQQDLSELESVFVISHNPTLRELFPSARTLRVRREGGHSRVIE